MAASRFKNQSKYKNASAVLPKREFWLQDILAPNDFPYMGNGICASMKYMVFCWDNPGMLAVYPVDKVGRTQAPHPTFSAHSSSVTDLKFSVFDDNVFASGGEDKNVRLWSIGDGDKLNATSLCAFSSFNAKIEQILFHPSADNIIAVASGRQLSFCDLTSVKSVIDHDIAGDTLQSISWNSFGSQIASIGKDRTIRLHDPRTNINTCSEIAKFDTGKEFQVQCLTEDKIAITHLNQSRERQVRIYDIKQCQELTSLDFGTSNHVMSMHFDEDTSMFFLYQKSESFINYLEYTATPPYLTPATAYRSTLETKSLSMVPKRAMNVMKCELNRFLQLTKNAVLPISFSVTRKSYMDFYEDIFPDTKGSEPGMTSQEWLSGLNQLAKLTTLDPQKIARAKAKIDEEKRQAEIKANPELRKQELEPPKEVVEPIKPIKVIPGVRVTPFKHIEGKLAPKPTFIYDLPAIAKTIPLDGHMLQVKISPCCLSTTSNKDTISGYAAVTLHGPGGQLAIVPIDYQGRLHNPLMIENKSNILDIAWDTFNTYTLFVACEDSNIRVWYFTPDSMKSQDDISKLSPILMPGHIDRPNILSFHPFATNVLASAGYDCKIILWDLTTREIKLLLPAVDTPVVALAWSLDGSRLATIDRNGVTKIYSPLQDNSSPIWVGPAPSSGKSARIVWLSDTLLLISGFDNTGSKVLYIVDITKNGSDLKNCVLTAVSITSITTPSVLMMHFDPDTNLIYITARGESSIFVYEYVPDKEPYIFELPALTFPTQNQEIILFPKITCDVMKCEIAKGIRLSHNSLEQFYFKIPRMRSEYFQDDIYPLTKCTWNTELSAEDWYGGKKCTPKLIDLAPLGVIPLSKAPVIKTGRSSARETYEQHQSVEDSEKQMVDGMIQRMQHMNAEPLKQSLMEGVADDEWDD